MGVLEERAGLCAQLVRPGESNFPFTNPAYPYAGLVSYERRESAADDPPPPQADPFAPARAGRGLAVWDVAAVPKAYSEYLEMAAGNVPSFRKTNLGWLEGTMRAFYQVGMVKDGKTVRRPADRWIVDLMPGGSVDAAYGRNSGWRLLEGAHALAHRSAVRSRFRPAGYGAYGSLTIDWLARLAVAMLYDLPVDVSGEIPESPEEAERSNDGLYRYGIRVCSSNAFHTPALRIPCIGRKTPVPDRDIALVAAGMYIEPHPKGLANETDGWLEVNRWSCMPTMVSVAGWELVDAAFHRQPASLRGSTPEFVIPAPSLMPADAFGEYISAGIRARGEAKPDNERYWKVGDWLRSRSYADAVSTSPTLPCRECLRVNMHAEGAPGRPDCPPPKERPDARRGMSREDRLWAEWDDRIDSAMGIIEKAVVYHESHEIGATAAKRARKARRKAARERAEMMKRIDVLERTVAREMRNGRPSNAERAYAEMSEIAEKLKRSGLETEARV